MLAVYFEAIASQDHTIFRILLESAIHPHASFLDQEPSLPSRTNAKLR
jgi:hypothetical protein